MQIRRMISQAIFVTLMAATSLQAGELSKALDAEAAGDQEAALHEWQVLADEGNRVAQSKIGDFYFSGSRLPQSYTEAAKWYRLSAAQGSNYANMKMAGIYASGKGVIQNFEEAVSWMAIAAKQDYGPAQTGLGLLYFKKAKDTTDLLRAYMWFNISAAKGSERSAKFRDAMAQKLSPDHLSEAQQMSVKCMESDYQDCDFPTG